MRPASTFSIIQLSNSRVRTAVKNYHGTLEIQEEKESFTVKILLYDL